MKVSNAIEYLKAEDPEAELELFIDDGDSSAYYTVKMISPVSSIDYVVMDAGPRVIAKAGAVIQAGSSMKSADTEVTLKIMTDSETARRLGNTLNECHRGTEEIGMGLMFMGGGDEGLEGLKVIYWEMSPSPFGE